MLDVVDLFREHDTRDELGVGSVRDAFADMLFPGTSTIMTRARYFLLVPWAYQRLDRLHAETQPNGWMKESLNYFNPYKSGQPEEPTSSSVCAETDFFAKPINQLRRRIMSKQSAAHQQEASQQYEHVVQEYPARIEPGPPQDAQRRRTEYEAADRNAEMIEEMAEDIEIALQSRSPRRVQVVLQLSKARTRGQRSLHRRANPVANRPRNPGL